MADSPICGYAKNKLIHRPLFPIRQGAEGWIWGYFQSFTTPDEETDHHVSHIIIHNIKPFTFLPRSAAL
jgi:hypothetical protein